MSQSEPAGVHYARFFDLSLDLLCTANHEGFFLKVNPAFTTTLGWSEDELLARRFLDFVHPEDVAGTLAEMVNLADGRATIDFANRYRCASGGWRWLDWRARPDPETRVIYAVAHDVSELKAASERADRAREIAEGANAAKSSFLTNMSHELRTPLNAIIGYSELLQEEFAATGSLEGRQLEQAIADLDRIRTAGRQLLGLVNGVLDLARIDAGRMPVSFETVNVPELLASIAGVMKPVMQANSNELVVQVAPELDTIISDGVLLRQVLVNLLANGARFTQGGTVTLSAEALGEHQVRFAVTDTGVGLDPEDVPRLLHPFVQGDESTTRRYGGSGLGLSISHRFAGLLGGVLQGTGERGRGARFWLDVPRSVAREVQTPSGPQTPESVDLLVLGPPELAECALKLAGELNMSAVAATSVMQALALARRYCPRVVVLDPMAPDSAGWASAAAICGAGPVPAALVVVHANGERRAALGLAAYVGKPLAPGALVALLARSDVRAGIPEAYVLAAAADDRALLASILAREGWRSRLCDSLGALEAELRAGVPDLLLIDFSLPSAGLLNLLLTLRLDPRLGTVPICALQPLTPPHGWLEGMADAFRTLRQGSEGLERVLVDALATVGVLSPPKE